MCGVGSLVYDSESHVDIKPSACRSWGCETCGPVRKAKCEIHMRLGQPDKFLTLTCRPEPDQTPTQRRGVMGKAFAELMRMWHRHTGRKPEYYVVVEETKRGEPHLHVLMRADPVPQRLIAEWWKKLTGWFVVWVKDVKDASKHARYLGKYLGKGMKRFGASKRYWSSRNWLLPPAEAAEADTWKPQTWSWRKEHPDDLVMHYRLRGFLQYPGIFNGNIRKLWRPPDINGIYARADARHGV
jgi:hypothetical protein